MTSVTSRVSWITAQEDGTEHAITDEAQAAGMATAKGVYEGICGEAFLVASLDAGPLRRCRQCLAFTRAKSRLRDLDERMTNGGWFSRLCHRRKRSADVGSDRTRS